MSLVDPAQAAGAGQVTRARGLAKLKRLYDELLRDEIARGILPEEQRLLDRLK